MIRLVGSTRDWLEVGIIIAAGLLAGVALGYALLVPR